MDHDPGDDPLERLLARVAPEVPADVSERALAALAPDEVARRLHLGTLERVARRTAFLSAIGAVLGIAAAVASLHATRGPHLVWHLHGSWGSPRAREGARPEARIEHDAASALALGGQDPLLADPFFVGRK